MRSDMFEVIIERPRGGGGWGRDWPRISWRQLELDDDGLRDGGPKRRRMGPRRRSKWLSENLAPLRRFLHSAVGRPWNEVHSEICAQIAPGSVVQKHVLDHLYQYVERHPVMVNGWPHRNVAYRRGGCGYAPLSERHNDFYVCMQTGRLLLPRRAKSDSIVHPLGPLFELRSIKGVWYVVHLAQLPDDWRKYKQCRDVLLGKRLDCYGLMGRWGLLHATYGRSDVYAVRKEQPRLQHLAGLLRAAQRYAAKTAIR